MPKRRPKIPSKTAVGYVRVSTNEQATQGLSPAAQASEIVEYCRRRHLLLLPDLARDLGVSGARALARRPYGRRVVALARDGVVGHVVATRLDRLFRDAADCLSHVRAWTKRGVTLHIINFGGDAFNSTSTMGQFFLTVMAAVAQMERGMISDRVKDIVKRKRARGEWLGSTPYGWLRTQDNHVLPNGFQQSVIRWMLAARAAGASFQEITDKLSEKAVPPPRGKHWHVTSVKRIVQAAEKRQENPR